jgi:hypothetical protein
MSRGGPRKGAGRKPLTGERKKRQMLVRLTQTNFATIAEHCAKNNLSKSEAVNRLVASLKEQTEQQQSKGTQ